MRSAEFLEAALRIGRRIARSAAWAGETCSWTVTVPDPGGAEPGRTAARTAEGDLYSGTAGIGLFLAELAGLEADPEIVRAAHGAVRHALAWAGRQPVTDFGFHVGRIGPVYTAARAAVILGVPAYREAAQRLLGEMAGHEGDARGTDVMNGAMGAIPPLLAQAEALGRELATGIAVRLGEHLVRIAQAETAGWSWGAPLVTHVRNLCGLGHGASGAGHALLELFAATGDERFRYAAGQAFRYERQFFDPEAGNWPDLRHPVLGEYVYRRRGDELRVRMEEGYAIPAWRPAFMRAWCHGAPGIGLARLHAYRLLGDSACRDEALAAIRTTLTTFDPTLPLGNYSLCHGRAGNAELLLEAVEALGRPDLRAVAEEAARVGWARFEMAGRPWPSGAPGAGYEPGLMLGEAGVGYFLLRLADMRTPSVLLPRAGGPPVPADPGTRAAADELRRRFHDAFWQRTLRVLATLDGTVLNDALRRELEALPGPADLLARLDAALEEEADARLRAYLADAMGPERVRYTLQAELTDRSVLAVHDLRRSLARDPDWAGGRFRLAPCTRSVRCEWDWDAWLADGERGARTAPQRVERWFAAYPAAGRVLLRPVGSLLGLVLAVVEKPASVGEAASRVAAQLWEDAGRADAVFPLVQAQVREAYAARLIDAEDPVTPAPHVAADP